MNYDTKWTPKARLASRGIASPAHDGAAASLRMLIDNEPSLPTYTLMQARARRLAAAVFASRNLAHIKLNQELAEERNRRERAENSEKALREALAFETAAVQEANHRVKNTLQIAASVLSLHSKSATSPEVQIGLQESFRRLHVLAKVHELLYRNVGSTREILMHELLRAVGRALRESFSDMSPRVRLRIKTDRMKLSPDQAIPMGLFANEALTNAYKYAFPDDSCGEIALNLSCTSDGAIILRIADNGVGLRPSSKEGGLGLKLVQIFAVQLRGTLVISPPEDAGGTVITLSIPSATQRALNVEVDSEAINPELKSVTAGHTPS